MKAELKSWGCIDYDIDTYTSDDNEFTLLLTLSIGPEGEEGINYFDLNVCTPEYLKKSIWEPTFGRHMLIVKKYDRDEIEQAINKCIEKCTGDNWEEIALKLSRYFAWEFEDYQPYVESKNS